MTPTAILLILIAAVIHATWNLSSKNERPSAPFFLVANTLGVLCLAPALFLLSRALPAFPPQVWRWLVVTGFFQAVYYAALAQAYRSGEMSVAYPLARATPAVLVALISVALGRGYQLSWPLAAGIVLITGGSLILPMRRFSDLRWKREARLTTGLALVAALGTTGYSLVDDQALRILRSTPALPVSPIGATVLYAFLEGIVASLWLAPFVLLRQSRRVELRQVWYTRRRRSWLTGVGIYLAYTLVLAAMAFASNVSYIVAFRQVSIPLGALLGILALKEPPHLPKLVGVAVIFTGLIFLALR